MNGDDAELHGKGTRPVHCLLDIVGGVVKVKGQVDAKLPGIPKKKRYAYKVKDAPNCASQGELVEDDEGEDELVPAS